VLIEAEALEHRYSPRTEIVISQFSHRFAPGTLTGVTGSSGSGKSTLLYVLALLLTPSGGTIRWDGVDVSSLRDAQRSRLRAMHVGFVFQDAVLDLSQTVEANVLEAAWLAGIPANEARSQARALMTRFGVAGRAHVLPGEVSGGQAQRIALCRALVKGPSIIFADEPTGNLDDESAGIVWSALAEAADEGATVIVATHDTERAHHLPHVLRLPQ